MKWSGGTNEGNIIPLNAQKFCHKRLLTPPPYTQRSASTCNSLSTALATGIVSFESIECTLTAESADICSKDDVDETEGSEDIGGAEDREEISVTHSTEEAVE